MSTAVATLVALVVGFLIGLLTFKQKQLWCPVCGARLRCLECLEGEELPQPPRAAAAPHPPIGWPAHRPPAHENGCGSRAARPPGGA